MATDYQDAQAPPNEPFAQPHRSGSNGCLWGCLIGVGLTFVGVLCMGGLGYWVIKSTVGAYTSDQAMEIETVEYSEEDLAALKARMDAFNDAIEEGKVPNEDLVLTAADINALIASDEFLRGKVFVRIEDGEIEGDVSIPLDELPGLGGRYFNGSATMDVSMDDGNLFVYAKEAEVNGQPVPEQFMKGMRNENIAKEMNQDREKRKFLRKFQDIRIDDDKLILEVRRDSETADDSGESSITPESVGIDIEPPVTLDSPQ
ncbi:MAG: hypothetical protein AAFU85_15245 [Planctomycetota bacterium]